MKGLFAIAALGLLGTAKAGVTILTAQGEGCPATTRANVSCAKKDDDAGLKSCLDELSKTCKGGKLAVTFTATGPQPCGAVSAEGTSATLDVAELSGTIDKFFTESKVKPDTVTEVAFAGVVKDCGASDLPKLKAADSKTDDCVIVSPSDLVDGTRDDNKFTLTSKTFTDLKKFIALDAAGTACKYKVPDDKAKDIVTLTMSGTVAVPDETSSTTTEPAEATTSAALPLTAAVVPITLVAMAATLF